MMKTVLFDTDIGIDDAMALLFLHCSAAVDLAAITTVAGNASVEDTTRNALHVKERFGIAAPVYRGAAQPLGPSLAEGFPDFVHGNNGLGDIAVPAPAVSARDLPAAAAIVEHAKASPGELSIVAVGPLTNVALALGLCPELPGLVRELVVMGGVFGFGGQRGNVSPAAEANFAGDPLAADKVLGSGMPATCVGLDVSERTIMDERFIDKLRAGAGAAGEFIHAITRLYFGFYQGLSGRRECPIHDSSAVACLLRPELYAMETAAVRVVTEGLAMGQSIAGDPQGAYVSSAWRGRPACRLCKGVDAEAVRQLYLDTLGV